MGKVKRICQLEPAGADGKPVFLYQDPKSKEVFAGNVEPVYEWQRAGLKGPKTRVLIDPGNVADEKKGDE